MQNFLGDHYAADDFIWNVYHLKEIPDRLKSSTEDPAIVCWMENLLVQIRNI